MLLAEERDLGKRARAVKISLPFVVGALCLLYAVLTATRSFPPTEGWYSYYAYLINEQGAVPYLDFELLFPPLYVYLIAAFTKVFGYGFLALRIFGALLYAAIGALAYFIFLKLTKKPIFAAFAGLLAAAVLQSEAVQIFYDYIRLMDVSVYAAILCLLYAVDHIEKDAARKTWKDPALYLGAFFAVAASLYKQSSGLIFLLYCGAFLLFAVFVSRHAREYLIALGVFAGVTLVLYGAMFAFLGAKGALSAYFYYNFRAAAAAKGGSIFSLLFGFIPRSLSNLWLGTL
ncbi:MAG: glycosyltransferase family 39 protein, partial [Clostridia bacterium]|nr:glycosyltransferase family 39 protein [Clostridia bacterium]